MTHQFLLLSVLSIFLFGCGAPKEDNIPDEMMNLILSLIPEDVDEKISEDDIQEAIRDMLREADESLLIHRPNQAEFESEYTRWIEQFSELRLPMPILLQELVERIEKQQLPGRDYRAALLILDYYERQLHRQLNPHPLQHR